MNTILAFYEFLPEFKCTKMIKSKTTLFSVDFFPSKFPFTFPTFILWCSIICGFSFSWFPLL